MTDHVKISNPHAQESSKDTSQIQQHVGDFAKDLSAHIAGADIPEGHIAQAKKHSGSIDLMAQRLLEMIENFDEVLRNETELLSQGKLKAVSDIQEGKLHIAQEYEAILRVMAEQNIDFSQIQDQSLKLQLKTAGAAFQDIMKKNLFALKSAQISAKRVAERIAKAAMKEIEKNTGTYTSTGQMHKSNTYTPAGVTDGAY